MNGYNSERFISGFWPGSSGELLAQVTTNMAATSFELWRSGDQGAHWSQIGMGRSGTVYPLIVADGQTQHFWRLAPPIKRSATTPTRQSNRSPVPLMAARHGSQLVVTTAITSTSSRRRSTAPSWPSRPIPFVAKARQSCYVSRLGKAGGNPWARSRLPAAMCVQQARVEKLSGALCARTTTRSAADDHLHHVVSLTSTRMSGAVGQATTGRPSRCWTMPSSDAIG